MDEKVNEYDRAKRYADEFISAIGRDEDSIIMLDVVIYAIKRAREEMRETCANACESLRYEWARLKLGSTDGRYELMEEAAAVCEDEIREIEV